MTAADRFREAVGRRDIDAMVAALAPDVHLSSPSSMPAVEGRDRVRAVFGILNDLFEDFEYSHMLAGGRVDGRDGIVSSHALVFHCRIGEQPIEGVDILDINDRDLIAGFSVFIRPLAGLQALTSAVVARFAAASGERGVPEAGS